MGGKESLGGEAAGIGGSGEGQVGRIHPMIFVVLRPKHRPLPLLMCMIS